MSTTDMTPDSATVSGTPIVTSRNTDVPATTPHHPVTTPGRGGGRGAAAVAAFVTLAVFGVALALGLIPRMRLAPQLASAAEKEKTELPIVTTVQPTASPKRSKLDIPANVQGLEQTAITARATGYLSRWLVDIGDHVKAGQTLATISAPDADQQTAQALAQVANSAAAVQQSQANVVGMIANTDQAQANVSHAQASLQQAKTDLLHSQAAVSQAVQAAAQTKSQIAQAQANLDLAKVTADRYTYMAKEGAIAQETADQQTAAYKADMANVASLKSALLAAQANVQQAKATVLSSESNVKAFADGVTAARAALDAAKANVTASQANVSASNATLQANNANYKRTSVLQSFQTITAPFDGIITSRNVDVGSLVSPTGTPTVLSQTVNGAAPPTTPTGLFTMVRTDKVRVFVSVPQMFISSVKPGQKAQVFVQELGNKPLAGLIVRNANILDPLTRTLSAEVDLDNPKGRLRPGMFATVRLVLPQPKGVVRIPDSALISDATGTHVDTVTSDNKIHVQPVTVGTDYGKEMDITVGLTGSESLVSNPTPNLVEGLAVSPQDAPPAAPPGGAPAAGGDKKQKDS